MQPFIKLLLIASVAGALYVASFSLVNANAPSSISPSTTSAVDSAYSVLKLLLEDEQHLTAIRRTKMVITFTSINDTSSKLIDGISDSSEQLLNELEILSEANPDINFSSFSDDTIAATTLDSLRLATAKEFLFDSDNFEKNLLLSQLRILPVIIHLAEQLEKKETNTDRKQWLSKLANQYKKHYQLVNSRISVSTIETDIEES